MVKPESAGANSSNSILRGRAWLAPRLLVVSALTNSMLWAVWSAADPHDYLFRQLPEWAKTAVVLPVVAGIFGLGYLVLRGSHDLMIHWLPDGKWKVRLVGDESSTIASASEFPELGAVAVYAPLALLGVCLGFVILLTLFAGGLAAVVALWTALAAVTAGWPSWAIVVTVLVILILLRQSPRR